MSTVYMVRQELQYGKSLNAKGNVFIETVNQWYRATVVNYTQLCHEQSRPTELSGTVTISPVDDITTLGHIGRSHQTDTLYTHVDDKPVKYCCGCFTKTQPGLIEQSSEMAIDQRLFAQVDFNKGSAQQVAVTINPATNTEEPST